MHNLEILYEDNHLLAINKPANLATQPSEHNQENLEDLAKAYIKTTCNKPGNIYLHPLHRLDKPTSGIVLFAKTSKALSRLQEAMRQKAIKKTYTAICEGKLEPKQGTLIHCLAHDSHKASIAKDGKEAILHYQVIEEIEGNTKLSIELETGRYHQIRAQLSATGHPILGDTKYGARYPYKKQAIALHHTTLSFTHPVTSQQITIHSQPPFH